MLTEGEYQRLLDAAPGWLEPVLIAAYHTGMREGEILGLTWDRVDLRGGWVHLREVDCKNKEARDVPLNGVVVDTLRTLRRGGDGAIGPVFFRDGSPVNKHNISYWIRKICRAEEIHDFVFHDLRHTFVTNMRKAGRQDRAIMAMVGHKSLDMLKRYDTIDKDDLRRVMDGDPGPENTITRPAGMEFSVEQKSADSNVPGKALIEKGV